MDNRRLLLAALLSAGFLILWNIIFPPARPEPTDPPAPAQVVSEAADVDPTTAAAPELGPEPGAPESADPMADELSTETNLVPEPVVVEVTASALERVELVTSRGVATISNRGGQLVSFVTSDRPGSATDGVEMVRERNSGEPYPFGWTSLAGEPLDLNSVLFQVTSKSDRQAIFEYRGAAGTARKVFRINDEDQLEVEATSTVPGWGIYLGPGIRNAALETLEDKYLKHGGIVSLGGDIDRIDAQKVHEVRVEPAASANWIALEDTYFLTGVVPRLPLVQAHYLPGRVSLEGERYEFETMPANPTKEQKDGPRDFGVVLEPGPSGFSAVAYLGPKSYETLKGYGVGLEKTMNWPRFFRPMARGLQIALNWIHDTITPNWGWSIVLMTVLIKLVLFPLTHKSYVSMQKMQQLNPKMEAIRKRYRPKLKDKQGKPNFEMQRKMNDEIQGLFKSEGVNPASGCLPMLVQMPVFLSFFYLLRGAPELWHAPWVGWIQDLSAPDPIYVLPVLMGVTQFLSTKMMPAPPNPTQRIIMNTFPLWFAFIAIGFPSGLVLYWLTNNILTIVQQGGFNRLKKAGLLGGGEATA